MKSELPFSLNIIVPCYNPQVGWESAISEKFLAFAKKMTDLTPKIGLIVVNDGSSKNVSDENFQTLKKNLPDVLVVSYPENRGKGYALRQGVEASTADFHLVTDADFPYTFESMRRVAETLFQEKGVVAGNRDTEYYEKVPVARKLLSQSLRWMLRNVIRLPVTDSQCGLKAFDNAGRKIFLATSIDRFLFDLEFLMLAGRKIKVTPCPVELREGVVFSSVGWKILTTEGLNFLKLLIFER